MKTTTALPSPARKDADTPAKSREELMWDDLRSFVLARIDDIDRETPWSEVEPGWWLHMMEVARLVRRAEVNE